MSQFFSTKDDGLTDNTGVKKYFEKTLFDGIKVDMIWELYSIIDRSSD